LVVGCAGDEVVGVATDGGGSGTDLGGGSTDLGGPRPDLGGTRVDLGGTPIDLGDDPIDLGGTPIDLGDDPIDLGGTPIDLGDTPIDLGSTPVDLGSTSIDLGGTPIDLGPADLGTDAGPACAPLPTNAADVYVDSRSSTAEVGTAACPMRTILGALALPPRTSGVRTVHVLGASTGTTYLETATVVVPNSVIVEGAGRAAVRVATSAPALCVGAARCVVEVRGSGILRALSVIPVPGGAPGSADGVALTATAAGGAPVVEDVESVNHGGNAFRTATTATLRGVRGAGTTNGVYADTGTSVLTIGNLGATRSVFETNRTNGVLVESGVLNITGAIASNNGSGGIVVLSVLGDTSHSISNCNAENNGVTSAGTTSGVGVYVGLGARASVTGTTMLGNGGVGLIFVRSTAAPPTSVSLSCNVFAVPGDATRNNSRAGLCVENSGATGSLVHRLNVFSTTTPTCPSTQLEISGISGSCSSLAPGYSDVVYQRATGGGVNPFALLACDYCP